MSAVALSSVRHTTAREARRPFVAGTAQAVSYELTGRSDAPVIVVLGGISSTRHVVNSGRDGEDGWWPQFVGEGKPIDTEAFRVLGIDYLTPRRKGRLFSTVDQADALAAALDAAEIQRVHAVVGASYGGMVALAFGAACPDRVERLVVIAAAHESAPMSTAVRLLQRRIVALGILSGCPEEALVIARGLAVTTYTTTADFERRFGSSAVANAEHRCQAIGDFLRSHGERFAARCSAERFLALAESIDMHCVDPADLSVPTTLIAAREDALVPISQVRELSAALGSSCELVELSSPHGHDFFLHDHTLLAPHVVHALTSTGIQQ